MLSTMLMRRGRIMSILKSILPAFLFIHILTTCFCVWSPHVCNSARLSTSEHFRSAFSVGVGQHPLKDGLIAMKVFLFVLLQNVFGLLVYCSALFALQLHCWTGRPKSLFLQLLGSGHSTVLCASHKTARVPPPPSTTHILTQKYFSKLLNVFGCLAYHITLHHICHTSWCCTREWFLDVNCQNIFVKISTCVFHIAKCIWVLDTNYRFMKGVACTHATDVESMGPKWQL